MKFKMKRSKNQKKSKMAIAFYVIAAIIMIFFVMSTYSVTVYIISLFEAGSVSLATDWMNILLYYLTNSLLLLVYSVLIFGIGYMIQLFKNVKLQEIIKETIMEEAPTEESTTIVEELVEA